MTRGLSQLELDGRGGSVDVVACTEARSLALALEAHRCVAAAGVALDAIVWNVLNAVAVGTNVVDVGAVVLCLARGPGRSAARDAVPGGSPAVHASPRRHGLAPSQLPRVRRRDGKACVPVAALFATACLLACRAVTRSLLTLTERF